MAWIGAQNSHGKNRIATIPTANETYYGLTSKGLKQLKKWEEQEREAVGKFYEKHPGWHLLQVSKCPVLGCGKRLYCEEHQYACRKWWVNLSIGLKR